jgi:hypothetical protein
MDSWIFRNSCCLWLQQQQQQLLRAAPAAGAAASAAAAAAAAAAARAVDKDRGEVNVCLFQTMISATLAKRATASSSGHFWRAEFAQRLSVTAAKAPRQPNLVTAIDNAAAERKA